ncbi:ACT domain-containing protein (plasmid) [Nicoliella spurrieriana]|uniref:UPF0735 ACT domain-containing protein MOO44_00760 n=1 Tax=Nicoliella spurrieriana TaxID=2925830 RepID=A0A976RQW9_9LACO|nr:ACT domain-containing protein [Nicoliella spurrieriana]UQS86232.1 ACT domain-containing protein [Nicoliella spurrieriana]
MEKYYIIDQSLLPETFGKVIQARHMLDTGKVQKISDAVKTVGISRGSYYKYKDLVYEANNSSWDRKALISFMLDNRSGLLSRVLATISKSNASILTINQNIPIHNVASVVISLDLTHMEHTINDLLANIKTIDGTSKVNLISIE